MSSLTYYLASLLTAVPLVLAASEFTAGELINLPKIWAETTGVNDNKWMYDWSKLGDQLKRHKSGSDRYLKTNYLGNGSEIQVPMEALQDLSDSLRVCFNDIVGEGEAYKHSKSIATMTQLILIQWGINSGLMRYTFPGQNGTSYRHYYNVVRDEQNNLIFIDLLGGLTSGQDSQVSSMVTPEIHGKHLYAQNGWFNSTYVSFNKNHSRLKAEQKPRIKAGKSVESRKRKIASLLEQQKETLLEQQKAVTPKNKKKLKKLRHDLGKRENELRVLKLALAEVENKEEDKYLKHLEMIIKQEKDTRDIRASRGFPLNVALGCLGMGPLNLEHACIDTAGELVADCYKSQCKKVHILQDMPTSFAIIQQSFSEPLLDYYKRKLRRNKHCDWGTQRSA